MNPGGQPSRRLRVFLCHDSADKPRIRELRRRLVDSGFVAWLDEEELLGGQDWQLEITKAVRAADVVIVCLSRSSIGKAGFVQREIKHALDVADEQPEGAIFLIPAKLEECETPERLRRWQWVNLFEERGYPRLVAALHHRAVGLGLQLVAPHIPVGKQERQPTPLTRTEKRGHSQWKVCLIGASAVGKTSLVARFVRSLFSTHYHTTVGVKIDRKEVSVNGGTMNLLLWDIEGGDLYRELPATYTRGSHGLFLVADGTRRATFTNLLTMASSLGNSLGAVPRVIALNKADLETEWELHANDIDALRAQGDFVIHTSAKSGLGVEDAFHELARRMLESDTRRNA